MGSEMVMIFSSNGDIVVLICIHAAAVWDPQTNVLFNTDARRKVILTLNQMAEKKRLKGDKMSTGLIEYSLGGQPDAW